MLDIVNVVSVLKCPLLSELLVKRVNNLIHEIVNCNNFFVANIISLVKLYLCSYFIIRGE